MNRTLFLLLALFIFIFSSSLPAQFETRKEKVIKEKKRIKLREEKKEREKKEEAREAFYEDAAIEERVRNALMLSREIFDGFLTVRVKDQVVYLEGRILSEEEKQLALQAIYQVDGVLDVKVNLIVKPLSFEDKEELEKLRGDSVLRPVQSIKLKPEKPVTLEAPRPSVAEKTAEKMKLEQDLAHEDERIKKDVMFAIRMGLDMVRVQGIYVSVYHGNVTLTGVVADSAMRQRAAQITEGIKGVKSISNQIQIR